MLDMNEYLEAVNGYANEFYKEKDYKLLDALEITVMCVCAKYGIEIYMEEYDTG